MDNQDYFNHSSDFEAKDVYYTNDNTGIHNTRFNDQLWLSNLAELIIDNLENTNLSNNFLAYEMAVSERQLTRMVKRITGLAPHKYVRNVRLNTAMDLLMSGRFTTIKEVAYEVGFTKSDYFSDLFEAQFGQRPMDILKTL